MSRRDPDALHTTRHEHTGDNPSVALLHHLSRRDRHIDEPLVSIKVYDFGHRSGVAMRVRDETRDQDATLDLDLDDLREIGAAIDEAIRVVETLIHADALIPRAA